MINKMGIAFSDIGIQMEWASDADQVVDPHRIVSIGIGSRAECIIINQTNKLL